MSITRRGDDNHSQCIMDHISELVISVIAYFYLFQLALNWDLHLRFTQIRSGKCRYSTVLNILLSYLLVCENTSAQVLV